LKNFADELSELMIKHYLSSQGPEGAAEILEGLARCQASMLISILLSGHKLESDEVAAGCKIANDALTKYAFNMFQIAKKLTEREME
jgi:hypothetical protein